MNQFQLILPKGHKLTAEDISRRRGQFSGLQVQVADPLLDKAIEFDARRREGEVGKDTQNLLAVISKKVNKVIRARGSSGRNQKMGES